MRNSQQLRVGEFDPGTRIPIVEQRVDARGIERLVQGVRRLLHACRLLVVDRHQHHLKRGEGLRPDDAVGIVILFDGCRHHSRHAYAIAAHVHGQRVALFVQHGGIHGLAI